MDYIWYCYQRSQSCSSGGMPETLSSSLEKWYINSYDVEIYVFTDDMTNVPQFSFMRNLSLKYSKSSI